VGGLWRIAEIEAEDFALVDDPRGTCLPETV